jgi:hypothetical protein
VYVFALLPTKLASRHTEGQFLQLLTILTNIRDYLEVTSYSLPWLEGVTRSSTPLSVSGVFGNRISWIVDAILENKDLLKHSGLKIYLILFAKTSMDRENVQRLQDGLEFPSEVIDAL